MTKRLIGTFLLPLCVAFFVPTIVRGEEDQTIIDAKTNVKTWQENVQDFLKQNKTERQKRVAEIDEALQAFFDENPGPIRDPESYETYMKYQVLKLEDQKKTTEADQNPKLTEARKELEKAEKALEDARKKVQFDKLQELAENSSTFDAQKNLSSGGNEGSLTLTTEPTLDTNILHKAVKLGAQILGTFAILVLIIGGVLMVTSEGDENRLQKGKNIFYYTIVGLLVGFLAYVGVQFIISVLFTTAGA